ncbi:MAG: NAD(P)/FAD-dependent oxidoreductase [Betaproteobacteria bacterium]|nr:FAD-dependent oxidoreductase [Betaproteobacteria bacterium]
MDQPSVTVVGAGIVGVCSALWLQRAGFAVTLVDSGGIGEGASFGNAGNISPGAVVPYLIPGIWKEAPGWLLDPEGPLAVRPGYFLKALPWLTQAVRSAGEEAALRTSRAMHALHSGTLEAYAELTRGTPVADLIELSGQLYVSEKPGAAQGSALAQRMRAQFGVEAVALDWMEVRELEPCLAPIFKSGLLLPKNGRTKNPHQLVTGLAGIAQRDGARVLRGKVEGFRTEGGAVRGLIIEGRAHPVQRVVIAAGAASRELAAQLGCRLPLEAERGYHITIADPGVMPRMPVTHTDAKFACAPMNVGLRLAGTAEFGGLHAEPDWRRTEVLKRQAQRMFPGVRLDSVSVWSGNRPSLPDGVPVLGRAPAADNAWFAFGNSHFGMSAGPVMGKLAAELVAGRPSSADVAAFSPLRFGA